MTDPIIVALDVDAGSKAERIVNRLSGNVNNYKVGSQLFTACGPDIIKFLRRKKKNVFLDLKYHDIPTTVARAVKEACKHKVWMITLHANVADDMMKLAVAAAREESKRLKITKPLLVGVTVLTSQAKSAGKCVADEVCKLAKCALKCGLDGVVSSAVEAPLLRKKIKRPFVHVCPGIRPAGADVNDQKRIVTPYEAICNGINYMVIGRPIVQAKDPAFAIADIRREVKNAHQTCRKRK